MLYQCARTVRSSSQAPQQHSSSAQKPPQWKTRAPHGSRALPKTPHRCYSNRVSAEAYRARLRRPKASVAGLHALTAAACPPSPLAEAGEVTNSSIDPAEEASSSSGWRAALTSWLRGHRPQPVPSEDGSEVQLSRPASVAASIAVLEEGGGGGGTAAAAAGPSGQQHEQQAAAASSSSSGEGGSSGGEIEPRGSGEASGSDGSRPLSRLPSRGPPTCLICLEVRGVWLPFCWGFVVLLEPIKFAHMWRCLAVASGSPSRWPLYWLAVGVCQLAVGCFGPDFACLCLQLCLLAMLLPCLHTLFVAARCKAPTWAAGPAFQVHCSTLTCARRTAPTFYRSSGRRSLSMAPLCGWSATAAATWRCATASV